MNHGLLRSERDRSLQGVLRAEWRSLAGASLLAISLLGAGSATAATALADAPVFSTSAVLGNVALALSVEYPTASRAAYPGTNDYSSATPYLGYFEPDKCYVYQYGGSSASVDTYFSPAGAATNQTCSSADGTKRWSGNFLNWATTQTIDPFRSVMTGGYRVRDEVGLTVLQKAYHAGQGLFPNKTLPNGAIAGATPFSVASPTTLKMRINGAGFDMVFTVTGDPNAAPVDYNPAAAFNNATVYRVRVRVKVCDAAALPSAAYNNCTKYGNNYKPEGQMQKYASRLRFAALGYLNQDGNDRDGAVLRARMKYVGPTYPVPGALPAANPAAEWDATTGIFVTNPDPADVTATNTAYNPVPAISNSGVANYLNKFGQITTGNYKSNDPVGELYYAAQRYYRNLGAVPEWNTLTNTTTAARAVDGFPVVQQWDDPIQYSCQKNFILGIGDIYTHADKHVPGNNNNASESVAKPAAVTADTAVNAVTATDIVGSKEGLGAGFGSVTGHTNNGCCSNNSPDMAGLAYWANVNDIRPDNGAVPKTLGKQTIQTFWVDVLEDTFFRKNTYYLAAKYGGFIVPDGVTYNYNDQTPFPTANDSWWTTSGETLTDVRTNPPTVLKRPDNYFTAGDPKAMRDGLTKAFERINDLGGAYTTSFSTTLPQVTTTGNSSFGARYDAANWSGEVVASALTFDANNIPSVTPVWNTTVKFATQFANAGWDTDRRIATWNGSTGIRFRHASLTAAQQSALDTSYRTGNDSADYLNYLRGDRSNEIGTASNGFYRKRAKLLGDIVGSRAVPVGAPALPMTDNTNAGYGAFKDLYKNRPTVLYVGANDGMLHAIDGSSPPPPDPPLTTPTSGREIMAYIPAATFNGPSSPSTPNTDGLAALGNPTYLHRYYVNAPPMTFDVDMTKTWNGSAVGSGAPEWRSILIGGMGKGGRAYYALDITDPTSIVTEADAAGKVLWEFTAPEMGYTFGEAVVAKTKKYGWTVILPSGYNTSDGRAYLYFVHPRTGALLEKVTINEGTLANELGLANINGYVLDYKDGYIDAVYGGDLRGNLWRLDVTGTAAYPAPVKIATLTDANGNGQPVTTRPLIELHPKTRERVVLVGTGRMLDTTDINSTQRQSFYAIKDGNQVRFNGPSNLPGGVTFPLSRSQLVQQPDLLSAIVPTATQQMGWFFDFDLGPNNVAWRLVTDPAPFFGVVAIAPTLPTIEDPCNPSGSSRVYVMDFLSGKTVVKNGSNNYVNYLAPTTGTITDLRFLSVSGKPALIAGSDKGEVVKIDFDTTSMLGLRRTNWRELNIGN